jgi:hypothetical protein
MSYVPNDFKCQYVKSCPHLDWLSTQCALESYQSAEDTYDEHLRIVDSFYNSNEELCKRVKELEKENTELKARLKLVHQRQFKPNKKKNEDQKEEKGTPVCNPEFKSVPISRM